MGKKKGGFNWKAREQPGGKLDNDEQKTLQDSIRLNGIKDKNQFQGTNALALPAKKQKLQKEKEVQAVGRILSRKQRKRLEKIVELKQKKANRGELLAALKSVQVESGLLSGLESLSSVQTKGVKRQMAEEEQTIRIMQTEGKPLHEVDNEIKVARKRRKIEGQERKKNLPSGDDVLGFQSSSDSEDSEEEEINNIEEDSESVTKQDQVTDEINLDKAAPCDSSNKENASVKPVVSSDKSIETAEDKKEKIVEKQDEASKSYKPVKGIVYVPVQRSPEITISRNKLPIIGEEQQIMECINNNQVVILSGETGSGKTTQVPQFLYEAGYGSEGKMIGITEPRRVAATAMSSRVALELGLSADEVSYQIRFQGNVTKDTKIKFMTDGVLLREIEKDFLLTKYSVVILDEAHERSVFTDILIGLLSRIVPLRHKKGSPLKLIIMSATLKVEDFTKNERLFKWTPPVVNVESRQFPVTVHFNKKTEENYLEEAYKKVCKVHRQLPEGGILVFVTGQAEVTQLVRRLRQTFTGDYSGEDQQPGVDHQPKPGRGSRKKQKEAEKKKLVDLPEVDLDNYSLQPPEDLECEGDLSEDEEVSPGDLKLLEGDSQPMYVLPLYSLLSQEHQNRIFLPPPPGARLCVVATNIAETSLTIPGVKYVVDSGKVKTKFYDKVTGVTTFVVTWTSQAAANQRAGRAGRQGPGHCYRLYSSAVFNNDMKDFAVPEIQQKPADGLLLQMKAMNIDKVVNFPFPSAPDKVQLRMAEERLQMLRLLTAPAPGLPLREVERIKFTSTVTPLGKAVASFPVSPRFGKMLALSHQHNLLPLAIALVSSLSVQEVLIERGLGTSIQEKAPKQLMDIRRDWVGKGSTLSLGDPMVLLYAICTAERLGSTEELCASIGVRPKALSEIRKLRKQLCSEVEVILKGVGQILQPGLQPPSQDEARLLQQLLLAGCGDQIGRRMAEGEDGYQKGAYKIGAMEQPAFIHSSSVLKRRNPAWIIYQEVFETDKVYLRCITEIQPEWLSKYVPGLCNLGKPLDDPEPRYSALTGTVSAFFKGTFGPGSFPLPLVEVELDRSIEKYKLFAKFILEGKVVSELSKFTSSLISSPVIMTKSWSNLQPRTEILYKTLANAKVDSAETLRQAWETDKQFLLEAYTGWLPEVLKDDVTKLWPPTVDVG